MVSVSETWTFVYFLIHLCSVELLIPYSLHICVLLFPDSYKLTMLYLNSSVYLVFSMCFSPFLLLYHLSLFAVHFFSIAPYKYVSNSPNRTSELVSEIKYTGAYNNTIHYVYDGNKRISEVNDIYYTYDEAGHLTTEVNVITRTGEDFLYDKGGNVVEVRPFSRGRYDQSQTFTYGDSNWKDLLTAYNGNEITYDEIGNPLTYYNGTEFNWTMGQNSNLQ